VTQYAVALVLPDEVERELDHLRGEFSQQMAYISLPHVTLAYPFEAKTDVDNITGKLHHVAAKTKPFTLVLDGFDYFQGENNVAYVAVANRQPVVDLYHEINRSLGGLVADEYEGRLSRGEFIPHVTIGARIPDAVLPLVKRRLGEQEVHYETEITSFPLLSDGDDGKWGVMSEFRFSG
jgi:2'-5' RNA ligase